MPDATKQNYPSKIKSYLNELPDAGDDDEDGREHHADGEDQLERSPVHLVPVFRIPQTVKLISVPV